MPRLVTNIDNQTCSVSEMRRRLAFALSKIKGDQTVCWNLKFIIENYQGKAENPDGKS